MNTLVTTQPSVARPSVLNPLAALRAIRKAHMAWKTRRVLAKLEPHLLDDIGLTEAQAKTEANKPIWDVPGHWLR